MPLETNICVVIPTYNNAGTVADVIRRVRAFVEEIIVVIDGSTDATRTVIADLELPLHIIDYPKNKGKGYALSRGLQAAKEMGFDYALTIDSDGQHYPEDIPLLLDALHHHPGSIVMGSRGLRQDNMPGKNTFANKFSNFWFCVQTGYYLPDTQTGFRIYPVYRMHGFRWLTARYEAELELLVFSAWANIRIVPVGIRVYYPPKEERVSHFRPAWDFTRISILNTFLCVIALVYGLPRRFGTSLWFVSRLILWSMLFLQPYGLVCKLLGILRTERGRAHYRSVVRWVAGRLIYHVPDAEFALERQKIGEQGHRPCIFIANHQSLLDTLMMLSLDERLILVAKRSVLNNPIFGIVARLLGFVSAAEGYEQSEGRLREYIAKGYSIMIFPEGTRTRTGKITRFHRGAFYLAEHLHVGIQPLWIEGSYQVLNKNELHLYAGRMRLLYLPYVEADDGAFGANFKQKAIAWEKAYRRMEKEGVWR